MVIKDELININRIGNATANIIFSSKSLETSEGILNKCKKTNIRILTYRDSLYPIGVKDIKKVPILLYYRGNIIEDSMGVAIVGSRRCTEYGKKLTVEAAEFLAGNNIPVISGMAKGIDGFAQTACLKAGGYTIAILGCGVDICYPKEHIELMMKILEKGAVISEYPPGTKPNPNYFPMRNRFISAMTVNELLFKLKGDRSDVLEAISIMELMGRIINVAGKYKIIKEYI
jgi:DNA processing protein